ncbi:EAL domain-containing protein [Rhizobium leguminosarum]|uniref:putative bifunctional diguanylate cyclase/phosphodiesterase n=1 Tax=Rhizobium leguminosarum TaxID=384 RepID=UPI000FF16F1F|nr:EAL domain-containing protein [Rhizobium leguminosarum]RWY79062.1 EAL domain-containing protein [Rhizobium leguminosarum]
MNVITSFLNKTETPAPGVPSFEQILALLPRPVLVAGSDGIVIYANASAEASLGAVAGSDVHQLFPGFALGLASMPGALPTVLVSKDAQSFDAAFVAFGDGHFLIDLRPAIDARSTNSANDLDELTGLSRRNALLSHLSAALSLASSSVAVHCLDLDRFKMVNDTLGHAVGDLLLKKVADRLTAACRQGDIVARLGGDEFVVLQKNAGDEGAVDTLASRIVDLVGRTYVINGHTINIAASVGVAAGANPIEARDLLRNGDLALYEAKKAGRGRYRVFESGMDANLLKRREMEIDLRRALALKQFKLNYQPFFNVTTNKVDGFEALLRWQHPVKGDIPPLSFVSLAEENGLIVKIGEWVMRTACMEAMSWPGEMVVAVNVSPLQFKADTLLETVASALQRSGLPAHRLEIEITEGALLDDTDNVIQTLNALRDLGVKISMDDFGTGYSSLSYLQKFPFNKIKIDRSFVAGDDADSEAILRAIASLGTSLGMAITAEGVETAEQLARIRGERCTHVQGYLTGRPMGKDQIPAFLAQIV